MKTSARNQLQGKVTEIKSGEVMSEVKIEVAKDIVVCATVTKEAVDSLGVTTGSDITALIKSSAIILSESKLKASARNVIEGKIEDIIKGQVNSEVKIAVGENKFCSVITNDAVEDLGLSKGETVYAIFKASSVILVA